METRSFPSIGRPISLLGFGLMRLPISPRHPNRIDQRLAESMIDQALAGGINYFDTAYIYHDGQSEPFAGKALSRHPRASYNIATKMPTWQLRSLDEAERIFDDQLAALKVDCIDFYLVHNLNSESRSIYQSLGLYEVLRRKKEQGLIRRLGFSMHDGPPFLERILAEAEWDFAQIQLNYVDWDSLKSGELYGILQKKGLPVVIMEPLRGGQLAEPPQGVQDLLKDRRPRASAAAWGLRYAASLPGVMTVLSGMSHPSQMAENLQTFRKFKPLDDDEEDMMRRAANEFRLANYIPCTGCRYCMDCPSGVEIPLNFAVYNLYRTLAAENALMASMVFSNNYRAVTVSARADQCVSCGECAPHCPQRLSIPNLMREISDLARTAAKAS
jgi:predicted aldo/keto reductase-like oxidoreductase